MRQTQFSLAAEPTQQRCTGNGDKAFGRNRTNSGTDWFSHRRGTCRLHEKYTYYEAGTEYLYGESGRSCQARGHLAKNNQNRFASHRLHRWLFRIAPVDQRVSVCAAGYDKRTSSGVTWRNRETQGNF